MPPIIPYQLNANPSYPNALRPPIFDDIKSDARARVEQFLLERKQNKNRPIKKILWIFNPEISSGDLSATNNLPSDKTHLYFAVINPMNIMVHKGHSVYYVHIHTVADLKEIWMNLATGQAEFDSVHIVAHGGVYLKSYEPYCVISEDPQEIFDYKFVESLPIISNLRELKLKICFSGTIDLPHNLADAFLKKIPSGIVYASDGEFSIDTGDYSGRTENMSKTILANKVENIRDFYESRPYFMNRKINTLRIPVGRVRYSQDLAHEVMVYSRDQNKVIEASYKGDKLNPSSWHEVTISSCIIS